MIVFKVSPGTGFIPCVFPDIDTTIDEVRVFLEAGEDVEISCLEMTREELDSLPEHTGY